MITKARKKLRIDVRLEHDQDTESPFDNGDVFSLCSLFSDGRGAMCEKLEELKEAGRGEGRSWWWVSCYRHGGEHWFLEGETPVGADHWDTTGKAGILYLDSGNPDDVGPTPQEAAEGIIEEYNRYCSGDCWWYRVEKQVENNVEGVCPCCETPDVNWFEYDEEEVDACGGIIGLEYALEELSMALKNIMEDDPDAASRYEVHISGDDAGRTYAGDVADKVREVGFRVEGDPEDGSESN